MTRAQRNNNPGNLRFSPFTQTRGALNDGQDYAKFMNLPHGIACMVTLLAQKGYRDLTLKDAIARYAPTLDGNDPDQYVTFVANKAGLARTQVLSKMNPFEFLDMVKAMIEFEGWKQVGR